MIFFFFELQTSKCFLRTSYLVHGLERLLHQRRRHEASRSPWNSRTNDGKMVVEISSICWYRTNWTRNLQKSDVKKCKCVKWRFWRRWRKKFRHSAISATLYFSGLYTCWHWFYLNDNLGQFWCQLMSIRRDFFCCPNECSSAALVDKTKE